MLKENKVYDLDYEIGVLNQKHDVSKEDILEVAKSQCLTDDQIAGLVHCLNEFDLLSKPKEVLIEMEEMCGREIKYDREHRRGRKPTTTTGIIRSIIRREVAIQGIVLEKLEAVADRPAGWYERILSGRQQLDIMSLAELAVCVGRSLDSLFGDAKKLGAKAA